ncbi:MAG TPA: hypothetical protein GXX29_07105 [Firmicutes bacterium]|nr:hypothetical protein [Bacillota bacterium]
MLPTPPGDNSHVWAAARVPGTCGELVQGYLDGEHMIITAPINRYSLAIAVPGAPTGKWRLSTPDAPKTRQALSAAESAGWVHGEGTVSLYSALQRGKGMGSSTADAAAAVAAACLAGGLPCQPEALGRLLAAIEPTDGTMHEGIVLFNSLTGQMAARWSCPDLRLAIVDWGGTVDTLTFHQKAQLKRNGIALTNGALDRDAHFRAAMTRRAFTAVMRGLESGNPRLIGWGASLSAFIHQRYLYKPGLEKLHGLVDALGGYGLCIAHTGTIAGLLFPPEKATANRKKIKTALARSFPFLNWLGWARLCDGGLAAYRP